MNKNMQRIGNQSARKAEPKVKLISFKVTSKQFTALKGRYGSAVSLGCRKRLLKEIEES